MQKMLPSTTRIEAFEIRVPRYIVFAPVDTEIADLARPGFWGHHARKIRPGDEIVIRRADMAWRVEFIVTSTGPGLVCGHFLSVWNNPEHKAAPKAEEPADTPDVPEGYSVNHAPKTGWRVWTKDPALEVSRGHKSRHEATLAAIAHAAKASGQAA